MTGFDDAGRLGAMMEASRTPAKKCPFCNYAGPSPILKDYGDIIVFAPIEPVVPGHVLVVPKTHVEHFAASPRITGSVAQAAGFYVSTQKHDDWNLITSKGWNATQTVRHLHFHLVPRRPGDELQMPWGKAKPQHG